MNEQAPDLATTLGNVSDEIAQGNKLRGDSAPPVAAPEQKPQEASVASASKTMSIAEMIEKGIRKRIPMSSAVLKMAVPAIDGYYLYWFRASNVASALEGGYEFVDKHEVNLVNTGIANDREGPGHTDLGSRVSMVGDTLGPDNTGPQRAFLMKIRQAWRDEDRAALEARAMQPIKAMFKGESMMGAEGQSRQLSKEEYVKTAIFNRPVRKVRIVR